MTDADAVTVVIPHHDAAGPLARALDSIEGQRLPVAAVVVVDDASSPAQRRAAEAVCAGRPGVQFVALGTNRGPGGARNGGWDEVRTPWVAFCDADDAWHPAKTERQRPMLRAGTTIVGALRGQVTGGQVTGGQVDEGAVDWEPLAGAIEPRRITLDTMALHNPFPTSSVVLPTALPARFDPARRYCEDYELWIKAVADGAAWLVPETLTVGFKAPYGASGLSAHLGAMAAGEITTLRRARRARLFSVRQAVIAHASWAARTALRLGRHARATRSAR